jgi:hypothetical protein
MNFGGFATPERKIIFDINDFDETRHPGSGMSSVWSRPSCLPHGRSGFPTAKGKIAPWRPLAVIANISATFLEWIRFAYGTRALVLMTSLASYRKPYRRP